MTQQDREEQNAPEDADGICVATVVSAVVECLEQVVVRNGLKAIADGLERRGIVEFIPSE
jgi:hypothetical protein